MDAYERGEEFYLYTGRGPSGDMHLGHLIPFMLAKWLQEKFRVDLVIQITDDEKYVTRELEMDEVERYTRENVLDILSLGFDKARTHVLIDTQHAGLLYNNALGVAKRITASTVKSVFGLTDSDNIAKYFFTAIQAVPAFLVSKLKGRNTRCLIPYGMDQDDHFRIARDVLPKLGYHKPASLISKLMPSLLGKGKMSTSDRNSAIYLNDPPHVVERKIKRYAFSGGRDTAEEQRKYGANPEVDVAFNIYRILEEDPNRVEKVYEDYRTGRMLSGEMKELAIGKVNAFLEKLRENRVKVRVEVDDYMFSPDRFK